MFYCKWNIYFWLVVFILVLLASCQNKTQVKQSDFYFDSASYINNEIDKLKDSVNTLSQLNVLNGETEQKEIAVDTSKTFKEMKTLFTESNINKAIFENEYKIDTFWQLDPVTNQNIEVLNYVAENPEYKVKWMQVFSNGSLKAKLSESNFLFYYDKEIYYQKGDLFSKSITQKTIGLDTINVFSQIKFLTK